MRLHELSSPIKLPTRPRKYGVGKLIGGQLYVHKMYEDEVAPLMDMEYTLSLARKAAGNPDNTITKFDPKSGTISFLVSPDWDTAPEPEVVSALTVKADGSVKPWKAPSTGVIYHHKWLFVKDDYTGFNVEESKERSAAWMRVMADNPEIKYGAIGKKAYWDERVVPLIK